MKRSVLTLTLTLFSILAFSQVPYGNNPAAGKFLKVKDGTTLYYEVYGKGEPFVLLHGGVYGYIDEFGQLISKLSESYQVICVATRGHGKSEIGHAPFTWEQRAADAVEVIRSVTPKQVILLGFSDGGYAAFKLAANNPQLVKKLIVIGASDRAKGTDRNASYTAEMLLGQAKDYFEQRLTIMPEPKRWGESLSMINKLYNDDYLSSETFVKIKCPTLIMSGDQDSYQSADRVKKVNEAIKGSQVVIIKDCGHVVLDCNFEKVWSEITAFLKK